MRTTINLITSISTIVVSVTFRLFMNTFSTRTFPLIFTALHRPFSSSWNMMNSTDGSLFIYTLLSLCHSLLIIYSNLDRVNCTSLLFLTLFSARLSLFLSHFHIFSISFNPSGALFCPCGIGDNVKLRLGVMYNCYMIITSNEHESAHFCKKDRRE